MEINLTALELDNCIKNIDSIAELNTENVYLFILDSDIPKSQFEAVGKRLIEILDKHNIEAMVAPSRILDKVYAITPTTHNSDITEGKEANLSRIADDSGTSIK